MTPWRALLEECSAAYARGWSLHDEPLFRRIVQALAALEPSERARCAAEFLKLVPPPILTAAGITPDGYAAGEVTREQLTHALASRPESEREWAEQIVREELRRD